MAVIGEEREHLAASLSNRLAILFQRMGQVLDDVQAATRHRLKASFDCRSLGQRIEVAVVQLEIVRRCAGLGELAAAQTDRVVGRAAAGRVHLVPQLQYDR